MRKVTLLVSFALLLSACQAAAPAPTPTGTLPPTATSTNTPTPMSTSTQSSTPTPTPIPWILDDAIAKLPEVYTKAVSPKTVEQYTQLLSVLPKEAQRWITNMGWGLEDLKLDANEVMLL